MKRLLIPLLFIAALARAEQSTNELGLTISPGAQYVTVSGDERQFREDAWVDDSWAGGIENATFQHGLGNDWQINLEGRAIFDEEDYHVRLEIAKPEVGFVRAGFTEFRSYYDDTGGFFRDFSTPAFHLGQDLFLRNGKIFVELGLTLPNAPKVVLGYERQFRDGNKSLLEWGSVTEGATQRKIFPSFKDVDETVDIFKLEIEHTIKDVRLADQFRYERYRNDNTHADTSFNLNTTASKTVTVRETYKHDAFYNTFLMDSHLNEKVYWSLGYLFTTLDGSAGLTLNTVPFNVPFDKNWFTQAVATDLDSHVVNLNAMFGPFKNVIFYAGVQAEKTDTDGFTDAILSELAGGGVTNNPNAVIQTSNDKNSLEETLGARFTGIPYTTVYVEGRWREQWIDLNERETDDAVLALQRATDTTVFRQDYRAGFNTSPIRRVTFSGRYRHAIFDNDYDHDVDTAQGYPAFITGQNFVTDEIMAKVTMRPCNYFHVSLKYQLIATDIETDTAAIAPLSIPSGTVVAGDYDAHIYSLSATVTPMSRLYLTGLVSYQDTRTRAFDNGAASVTTYEGDVLSFLGTLGCALDKKTDATIEYSFSQSANFQNNSAAGLPLGLDNERHAVLVSLSRKLTENLIARIRYGFYDLVDNTQGGVDDYTAHLFSGSCSLRF